MREKVRERGETYKNIERERENERERERERKREIEREWGERFNEISKKLETGKRKEI